MPPPPEEIAQLMRFVAAKTKNVTSPMSVMELCRQFKKETGSLVLLKTLFSRIEKYRLKIHEMTEFDMGTKVKMIFALSASVDGNVLVELKKVADVELDDQQRIIQYKQKDGGLELSGKHLGSPIQLGERDIKMIQLLADKSETTDTPIADRDLLREFKEKTKCTASIEKLVYRYQRVKRTIYHLTEIDKNTRIKMMFISNAQLSDDVLEEIRKDADVEVDEKLRIISYKQKNGGLELNGRHMGRHKGFSINQQKNDEMRLSAKRIFQFLAEKSETTDTPMVDKALLREFKKKTRCRDSIETLKHRYVRVKNTIYHSTEIDKNTKIKMMFISNAKLPDDILEELRKDADVEVDEKLRIISYKQKGGGLELCGQRLMNQQKDGETRLRIFQFLAEKSKITDIPIADRVLMREFKETTGCSDSIETIEYRYRLVKNTFYQSTEIDKNTKIKMMFISNVKLSDETLKELRSDADVQVDEEGRITKYKSKDGSLELEGRHGQSSTWKSNYYRTSNEKESERDDDKNTNCQKGYEKTQTDLVRFLIQRTKHATSPLSIKQMAKNYKKEFKKSEYITRIVARIHRFRLQIHKINLFDKPTRVKMLFALSVPINAKLLKELRKDAIVDLDVKRKIEKYKAKDGSLEMEGDHSQSAKVKAGWAAMKKRRVVNDSRGKKRARVTCSSSAASEKEPSEESDDEESEKSEDDIAMDSKTNNIDIGGDDFDQLSYHYYNERDNAEDMDHIPTDKKPENFMEVKLEIPEEPSGGEYDLIKTEIEECIREVKQEAEEDGEGPSTTSSLNVSLLKFLYHFRRPAIKLKVPFVANKFDNEIKKLVENDEQISITKILKCLESLIQILKTPDEMHSDEVTISLSDFIVQLGLSTWFISHPLINEFQRKTRELVATEDQKIPIKHIRYAMEKTLDKILH